MILDCCHYKVAHYILIPCEHSHLIFCWVKTTLRGTVEITYILFTWLRKFVTKFQSCKTSQKPQKIHIFSTTCLALSPRCLNDEVKNSEGESQLPQLMYHLILHLTPHLTSHLILHLIPHLIPHLTPHLISHLIPHLTPRLIPHSFHAPHRASTTLLQKIYNWNMMPNLYDPSKLKHFKILLNWHISCYKVYQLTYGFHPF